MLGFVPLKKSHWLLINWVEVFQADVEGLKCYQGSENRKENINLKLIKNFRLVRCWGWEGRIQQEFFRVSSLGTLERWWYSWENMEGHSTIILGMFSFLAMFK